MESAVKIKREQNLHTTIGVQLLLLPDNKDEIVRMGKELRKIGVDYFTIKPFSQHPQSQHIMQIDYKEMLELEKEVKELQTESYSQFQDAFLRLTIYSFLHNSLSLFPIVYRMFYFSEKFVT